MAVLQYVGARYVPKFYENPETHDSTWKQTAYEALVNVTYNSQVYVSKKPVPESVGAPDANTDYWALIPNPNYAQFEALRDEMETFKTDLTAQNEQNKKDLESELIPSFVEAVPTETLTISGDGSPVVEVPLTSIVLKSDTKSNYELTTKGGVKINESGYYEVSGSLYFIVGDNGCKTLATHLMKNNADTMTGATELAAHRQYTDSTAANVSGTALQVPVVSKIAMLNAGDVIFLAGRVPSGDDTGYSATVQLSNMTFLQVKKVG